MNDQRNTSSFQKASNTTGSVPSDNGTSIALLSSLAVSIVAINSLVIFLFMKKKTLRTSSNYPLFSLAACDLITGLFIIPLFITTKLAPGVSFNTSTEFHLGYLVVVLHVFVAISTVYHIVVVTAERYMAIKMPLRHRLVGRKSVCKVLAMVWLTAAIISCIPFTWINKIHPVMQPSGKSLTFGYAVFCLVVVVVLPYVFLISAFVAMFKAISGKSAQGRLRKEMLKSNQSDTRQRSSERKCLVLFAAMATAFAVCWFPWFVIFLLHQMLESFKMSSVFSMLSLYVRYLTAVINPLLYTFLKRDFYHALKTIFTRDRHVNGTRNTTAGMRITLTSKEATNQQFPASPSGSLQPPQGTSGEESRKSSLLLESSV